MSKTAVAYYRTSSAANVGEDKDSLARQRAAVSSYAKRAGLTIVREFYDAAVSGADAVDARPGFVEMLAYIASNGARTIIVETASRFARDLIVQETGYRMLKGRGVELLAADAPDSFLDDGPTARLIRQILGAVAEFDKAMTVTKLRGARDRKSKQLGHRIEGAKRLGRLPTDAIAAAHAARARGLTLAEISEELAASGFLSREGTPYGITSVVRMLKR